MKDNTITPVDAINNVLTALEQLHSITNSDNIEDVTQALESASIARYLCAPTKEHPKETGIIDANKGEKGEFVGYEAQVDRYIKEPYSNILQHAIQALLHIPYK